MSDNIMAIFSCLFFVGFGLFALIHDLMKQSSPKYFNKLHLMSIFFMLGGILMFFMFTCEELSIFISGTLLLFGFYFLSQGLFNRYLSLKCTHQITALCLYYSTYGKGEHPVTFAYTYEGDFYKAKSQQTFSTNMFVMNKSYRIYINPEKPQYNIVFPKSMKDYKSTIIFGLVLIAAGIAAYFAMRYI